MANSVHASSVRTSTIKTYIVQGKINREQVYKWWMLHSEIWLLMREGVVCKPLLRETIDKFDMREVVFAIIGRC